MDRFIELRNNSGWKEPLVVIWYKPLLKAGLGR